MITAASAAVALLLATPHGQTAPQTQTPPPGSDITSSLNSGPPRPATYLAPAPVTPAPVATPTPAPAAAAPATVRPATPTPAPAPARPAATRPPAAAPATTAPATTAPARPVTTPPASSTPTPAPVRPAPARPVTTPPAASTPAPAPARPTPAPARPTPTPVPATVPAPAPVEAPPPPAVPAVTVLDAAARAALPFRVDLPAGFELVTGRPGPDFRIYTIRRGDRSFAMIYAGPASQFPIYSGEVLEAAGRASVVSTEDGVRHAREHLFQREGADPREIHVWTMSLEGADRALAERIAQSVDVR